MAKKKSALTEAHNKVAKAVLDPIIDTVPEDKKARRLMEIVLDGYSAIRNLRSKDSAHLSRAILRDVYTSLPTKVEEFMKERKDGKKIDVAVVSSLVDEAWKMYEQEITND